MKAVPIYLKGIKKYDYFFDNFVESVGMTKEEYVSTCEDMMMLFKQIESKSMHTSKLWILGAMNKTGIGVILLSCILLVAAISVYAINFVRALALVLTSTFVMYIILVTGFCIFYLIKTLRAHRSATENIKKLNMYVFTLNIRHMDKGVEFSFHVPTKEFVIQKLF